MKQYSKLFSLVALVGVTSSMLHARDNDNGNENRVVPFLQWRSQGRDTARKLYGTTSWAVYQPDMEDQTYGTFNVTVQYDQSFRNSRIADCLFGPAIVANNVNTNTNNNCNDDCDDDAVIMISGLDAAPVAGATTRGPRELMAENFLLPRDFRSVISFSPKVKDVVVDFDLFVGFSRWCNGLYFRLYGPVVWNKVNLRARENVINPGTASGPAVVDPVTGDVTYNPLGGGYQDGFFDVDAAVPTQSLFNEALQFFGGCTFPRAAYENESVTVQPLRFAKFSDCNISGSNPCDDDCNGTSRHKTGFAELRGEFGYNYIRENYRFLINIQAAAPTGTKIKAEYLFPAYVGNGHHWELGVGLGGAWRMWCSEDAEKSFNFIVEADITHLFKAKQQRTFDLKCKPLSRYMLAERLIDQTNDALQLNPNTPVFDVEGGEYAPVANFSTRNVKVSIGVQGDLVAMFNYTCRGFSWDLGYNFWAMSSSKIKLSCDDECEDSCGILPFPVDTWALKGDASIAGYASNGVDLLVYGLGATESKATIFQGVNATNTNQNIDNAQPALGNNTSGAGANPLPLFAFDTTNPINTSVDPIFISIDDLDIEGAEQRGLSHKVFTHFSYTWRDCSDRWMPYVGAGFSAEFGSHSGSGDDCDTNTTIECDTCPSSLSCALSKWAVEIKGGVSFH
jgi:hypothetical protein